MRLLTLTCVAALLCCSSVFGEPIPIADIPPTTPVTFEKDILPIFQRSCLACHSASERQGELVLETPQTLLDGGDSGPAIVPERSGESLLLKLAAHQEESFMPPPDNDVNAPMLTSKELGLLRLWIDQGARSGDMKPASVAPPNWQPLSSDLSPVYALALSPDGQHVAATRANQLYIYQLTSGKLLATLGDSTLEPKEAHRDLIQSLTWSNDGTLLASGGFREAKIWRKPHDLQRMALPLKGIATAFAVSSDRSLLASASADHVVQLWDAKTGQPKKSLVGHQDTVTDLCFTADGQKLISVAQDQTIRFWNCEDGTPTGILEPPAAVQAIELVPTAKATDKQSNPSQLLVSGGADKLLQTWTIPSLPPRKLEVSGELHAFTVSGDGQVFATSGQEGNIAVKQAAKDASGVFSTIAQWKLESGRPDHMVLVAPPQSDPMDNSPSAPVMMLATETNGELSLWQLPEHQLVAQWRGGESASTALAVSSDGTLLATGRSDGGVALWNLAASGKQPLGKSINGAVPQIAFNTPRTKFAVAGKQGDQPVIFVCDSESGEALQTLTGHTAAITCYAFSPDGSQLVSGSEDRTVRVWKLDAPGDAPSTLEGHAAPVLAVAFSPDGQHVYSGGKDHSLRLWDTAEQKTIQEFVGHTNQIVGLGFLTDQPFSVSADGTVRFWSSADGAEQRSFAVDATPEAFAVSPDGANLVLGREDNQISIHRLKDGALLHTLFGHAASITSLSVATDGQKLLSTSTAEGAPGTAIVWDLSSDSPRHLESVVDPRLTTTAFASKNDRILLGDSAGEISIQPLRLVRHLEGGEQPISALKFAPDGQVLLAAAKDGAMRGYSISDGQTSFSANHGGSVCDTAFSPDQQLFATAGEDAIVRLWKLDGQPFGISKIVGATGPCTRVSFSRDGTSVVVGTGGDTPKVHVFDLKSGLQQQQFSSHRQAVLGIACGTNDKEVISASADGVWQWTTHSIGQTAAHEDAITSLVSAPDQPMQVFSGSLDGKIRRWDLTTGGQLGQFNHGGAVLDIDVQPSGQRLASVSDDHTAKLWDAAGNLVAEMKGDILKRRQAGLIARELSAANQRLKIANQRLVTAQEVLAKRVEAEVVAAEALSTASADLQQKKMAVEQEVAEPAPESPAEDDATANTAQQALEDAEAAQKLAEQKRAAAVSAVKSSQEAVATMKTAVAEAEANLQEVQTRLDSANRQVGESERPIRSVRFSPAGDVVTTAGDFPSVQIWNAETGEAVGAFSEQASTLYPIAFLDDRRLVSASENPAAIVWDTQPEWQLERTIGSAEQADLISDRVTSLAFNPTASQLLVGGGAPSRGGELSLFHIADGSRIHFLPKAHGDTVYGVEFSPDGTQFISAGADQHVRLWNMTSDTPLKQFEGHTDYVFGVDWKADAQAVVSASGDQTLKVWDIETGDQQRTISGFGKDITAVRHVGDSSQVVSSCGDGVVRLHDAANGKLLRNFGAGVWLHCVDATTDGKRVVAGSEDGRLFLWDGSDGKQLKVITVGQ